MVILDTSIIIDHLRTAGRWPSALERFIEHQPEEVFALSLLTVQELYSGKSTRNRIAKEQMITTIKPFQVLGYDYDIAVLAGILIRDNNGRMQFADAAIAATAIIHKCSLATLNTKDFSGIKALSLLRI